MFKNFFVKRPAPAPAPKVYPIGASSTKPYPFFIDENGNIGYIVGIIPRNLTADEIQEILKDTPEIKDGVFNIYNVIDGFSVLISSSKDTIIHSSTTTIGGQKVLTNGDYYFSRDIKKIMEIYWNERLLSFAKDAGDLVAIDDKLFLNNDNNGQDVRIRFIADTFWQVHAAISVGIGFDWIEAKTNGKTYYIAF